MNILQAIILAAGKGTRLKDKTANIPKALVPINGVPLIIRTLDILSKYEIEENYNFFYLKNCNFSSTPLTNG